jgi:hypothetical protein
MKRALFAWLCWLLACTGNLPGQTVAPSVERLVGRGLIDTLTQLVGSRPRIDTMSTIDSRADLGEETDSAIYITVTMTELRFQADTTFGGSTVRSVTQRVLEEHDSVSSYTARGVLIHEMGHWLAAHDSQAFKDFSSLGGKLEAQGFAAEQMVEQMQREMFADAFEWAAEHWIPNAHVAPYPYFSAITMEQQAYILNLVIQRWGRLS